MNQKQAVKTMTVAEFNALGKEQKAPKANPKPKVDKRKYLQVRPNYSRYDLLIGIDTGTNTGYAIMRQSDPTSLFCQTLPIHNALALVFNLHREDFKILVRVEDARLRKWFGKTGNEVKQGAGSIKRDAEIWEAFLEDKGIDYELVPPKANKTKLSAVEFAKLTGYSVITSEHARDAAMLIFGL